MTHTQMHLRSGQQCRHVGSRNYCVHVISSCSACRQSSLTDKEVAGPDGLGVGVVDGFAFDAEGIVWVTNVLRNGLGIITTEGDYHVVFEEANEPLLVTLAETIAA